MSRFSHSDTDDSEANARRRMEKYFVTGDEWGLISLWPSENIRQGRSIADAQRDYHGTEPFPLTGSDRLPFLIDAPEFDIARRRIRHDELSEELAGILSPYIRLFSCQDSTGSEFHIKNGFAFGPVSGNAAIYGLKDDQHFIDQLHYEMKGGLTNEEIELLARAFHRIGSRFDLFLFSNGNQLIDLRSIHQPLIYLNNIPAMISTPIEHTIINDAEWQDGIEFGKPRFGHPEGRVIYHIADVMGNVDELYRHLSESEALQLRLTALIHDTFKHKVNYDQPRTGDNHHARIARKYAEKFISDETVLNLIEFHDHAYHAWGKGAWYGDWNAAGRKLDELIQTLGNDLQLFYYFYWCDNTIPGKDQAPLKWFEEQLGERIKRLEIARQL